jgi:hypothetical protein
MAHLVKIEAEIADESRRRAQAKVNERREAITIRMPSIRRLREPGPFGCWWSLGEGVQRGQGYVTEAAAEVANMWRLGTE